MEDLDKHFLDLEEKFLRPAARSSRKNLEELLTEDFFEVGASGGVYDRKSIVSAMLGEYPPAWSIANFKVTPLSDDIVLVTYLATTSTGPSAVRSSIWKRSDGRWRMAFHQGTKVAEGRP
jgi:hypothetical protein